MNEKEQRHSKDVKCLIWDLDDTLWHGTLSENPQVILKPGITEVLESLDHRGILLSIASKNNFDDCWRKLEELRVAHYFLYPQISWNAKSAAVDIIGKKMNIGLDTIAFIDDQPFEREEVGSTHSEIQCIDAGDYLNLLNYPRFNPRFVTEDSARRREMYQQDIRRNEHEQQFSGPKEAFLATLNMVFQISDAGEFDLQRAEELTVRTNQLNATGVTYSFEELHFFSNSDKHDLLVCELTDKYGSYGKIGLALVEKRVDAWQLRMMLMSCRVMSRGVGTVLLAYIMNEARRNGVKLRADFRMTDRNRMMYVTYKFCNFYEISNDGTGNIVFENELLQIPEYPDYIDLRINRNAIWK
ncbi:hypothetical protein A3860_05015 [Niastella vici]|uniref:N-acetyltransferase domain-containing protein n=1 Tax=Niastella vici TaxID=1703345 RepID=A0A1V9FS18_9BACT|nr:HAD-IIIC family phosphatase [Niastella vici]OQP61081.1 hypothetical protein A3860_05015 [Niastella vici]